MRIIRLTWRDIEDACRIISAKIQADRFQPDVCVAVSRGGFPPARIICDLLNVRNLAAVKIEYYSGIDKVSSKPELVYPLNANVRDKTALVVDDVADRGESLILAKRHVQSAGARAVKVATLHYKPWSRIRPDYYAREYRSWILYPWELYETIRETVTKLLQDGRTTAEIDKEMRRMNIGRSEFRRAIRGLT